MHWWGSGFIPIITYAASAGAEAESFAITTENNLDILTESSLQILVEAAP